MRGKEVRLFFLFGLLRITPAYAGKRKSCAAQKTSAWDHPRMCGEKLATGSRTRKAAGSPPHVRGKESEKPDCDDKRRITPACAGKSGNQPRLMPMRRDHPRMGGEKRQNVLVLLAEAGSPPHGRGKAPCRLQCFRVNGDHPRMGGEKTKKIP